MKWIVYWTADMKSSKLWSAQLWLKSHDFNRIWTGDRDSGAMLQTAFSGFSTQLQNCVRNCEDHSLLAEFTWRANPMLLDPSPFTHAVEERLHCFQSLLIHLKCGAAVKVVFSKTNLSRHWFTDNACCTDKRTAYQGRNRRRWLLISARVTIIFLAVYYSLFTLLAIQLLNCMQSIH